MPWRFFPHGFTDGHPPPAPPSNAPSGLYVTSHQHYLVLRKHLSYTFSQDPPWCNSSYLYWIQVSISWGAWVEWRCIDFVLKRSEWLYDSKLSPLPLAMRKLMRMKNWTVEHIVATEKGCEAQNTAKVEEDIKAWGRRNGKHHRRERCAVQDRDNKALLVPVGLLSHCALSTLLWCFWVWRAWAQHRKYFPIDLTFSDLFFFSTGFNVNASIKANAPPTSCNCTLLKAPLCETEGMDGVLLCGIMVLACVSSATQWTNVVKGTLVIFKFSWSHQFNNSQRNSGQALVDPYTLKANRTECGDMKSRSPFQVCNDVFCLLPKSFV